MVCLRCDSEQFDAGESDVTQEFKGKTLVVKTPVMICRNCGWYTIGFDQIDELRKRTQRAYEIENQKGQT